MARLFISGVAAFWRTWPTGMLDLGPGRLLRHLLGGYSTRDENVGSIVRLQLLHSMVIPRNCD